MLKMLSNYRITSINTNLKGNNMNWTESKNPTEGVSYYDHVISETPIGRMIIEWKSWKDRPSYDVMLDNEWIGVGYDLEEAKQIGVDYLKEKLKKLTEYMQ